jgi:UDP-N-acetylenolpyruvoylglucosamine reductase
MSVLSEKPADTVVQDILAAGGVRGKLTPNAPLAKLVWFKSGGTADWLFEPADLEDLTDFSEALDHRMPIMALGLGSNMIVRDGPRRAGWTARWRRAGRGGAARQGVL